MASLKHQKLRRTILLCCCACFVIVMFAVIGLNKWITRSTRSAVFTDQASLPANHVGLVLGSRRFLESGRENRHFRERVDAAAALYRAGKVRHLLLSGDNHADGYDEPTDMKDALLALNVPDAAMTLDYAGFRTLDSVVRARKVFGQSSVTLITDDFHAARAVFLSEHSGLDAVAFCSEKVPAALSMRSRVREVGARVKAVLDLYVLQTEPRFLGEPVDILVTAAETRGSEP